jgi:hypothetical protein
MEGAINEGVSIVQDVQNIFPKGMTRLPLLSAAMPMLQDGFRNSSRLLGNMGSISQPRSVDRIGDLVGIDVGRFTGGRPGLGFLFEVDGYGSLMHLADGVHEATSEDDLEDMADVCQPDVLVMQASGMAVEPLVRAARILGPKKVLLYRSRDPYRRGQRGQTLPISSFVGALEEGAPDCKVIHLRKGNGHSLDRSSAPASTPLKPKATSSSASSTSSKST